MSKILTAAEAEALTAQKHDLVDQQIEAKSQGESDRLAKQAWDIQKQLDDDMNERRRSGFDEARGKASSIVASSAGYSSSAGGPTRDELRSFVTPGSTTTDMWIKPPLDMVMGTPDKFTQRLASSYLTTDTATTGSAYFFVPELYRNVTMGLLEASGILEAQPTMIVTNHLRPIQVPVLTSDAVATAGTEGSPATATNTEGDHVDLGAFRYDGSFTLSVEMLMSSEYDLPGLLSTFATRAIANKVAAMLALGNGTTEPQGLFTASAVTVGTTAAATTDATINEGIALTKSLGKGYRKVARMVASDELHTSWIQTTNDDGDYTLKTIEGGGQQFCGKPLYTEPWADQSGMSAAEVHAIYGDFSGYFVRLSPMFLRRSDADPLNPVFAFAVWMDAKIADANSLVALKLKT